MCNRPPNPTYRATEHCAKLAGLFNQPIKPHAASDHTAQRPHCAYAFINARGKRIKLLIHDGLGLWLAQRRLHSGRFAWIDQPLGVPVSISAVQWRALTQGLPWARIEQAITAH